MLDAGMFSERDAQRIANAVLAHERRGTRSPPVMYPTRVSGSSLKICRTAQEWRFGTRAMLDEYGQFSTLFPPKDKKVEAENRVVTLPTDMWVIIGKVGDMYRLLSFSMQELGGFDVAKDQFLGHTRADATLLQWIDKPDLLDYPGFDSNYDQNLQSTAGGGIAWAAKPTLEDVPGYDPSVEQIIEHGIMGRASWGPKPLIPPAP